MRQSDKDTHLYGKIFEQIYDSSIAEDWQVRVVFQDMIVLCDINGVVNKTPESISRRTNVPLDIVKRAIEKLESPDPESQTPDADGRRIIRLDEHRTWGWEIVNYQKYRDIASDEQRREKTKQRTRKWRSGNNKQPCDAPVTLGDAGDAMQKQREKQKQRDGVEGALAVSCIANESQEVANGKRDNFTEPTLKAMGQIAERPSWKEFWAYCQIHGGPVEWYAKDKFLAQEQRNWRDSPKWTSYADRIRGWWENDGRPLNPGAKLLPRDQIKYLEEEVSKHPANRDSTFHRQDATELQRADLRAKRIKLKELKSA